MKVNKEIIRGEEIKVKCIKTYLANARILAEKELFDTGGLVDIVGEGEPRIRPSLKQSVKYGEELELLFFGRRKVEKFDTPMRPPKTFGYIILTQDELHNLISSLCEVEKKWKRGKIQ